jgi:hypothetical protein
VPASQAELQDTLERELLTGLDTDDRLRADVAALLEHALTPIQREQRINIDIAREILVKINVLMQRQTAPAPVPPSPGELAEGQEPTPGPCPYMGLAAFQAEDAEWFFGREQLVADLLARLSEVPFLAVVGPSGSGKSSALRAGLLPAFLARHAARRQQLDGPADSGGVSSERAGRPRCARA